MSSWVQLSFGRATQNRLVLLCAVMLTANCLVGSTPISATDLSSPPNWETLDFEAERQSRIGSGVAGYFIGKQDKAITLNDSALTLAGRDAPHDSIALTILLCHRGDYFAQQGDIQIGDSLWRVALAYVLHPHDSVTTWWQEECNLRLGIASLEIANRLEDTLSHSVGNQLTQLRSKPTTDQLRLLFRLGFLYDKLNRYPQADSVMNEVVEHAAKLPDANPYYATRVLMHLAENQSKAMNSNNMNRSQQQDSAIQLGEKALQIVERYAGKFDTTVAFVLNRLGDYYVRGGQPRLAEATWERAWEINRALLPPENIEYQGSIDRMGSVCFSSGRYTEAEAFRREALELRKRTQGAWHPEVASMLGSLGRLLMARMKYDEAAEMFAEALAIRKKVWAWDHSDIAASLIDLGKLQMSRANFSTAEQYFEEALTIRQHSLGDGHAQTADCRDLLGDLYSTWSRPEDALEMYSRAFAAREDFLAPNHPALASSLRRLASVHMTLEQWPNAHASLTRALAIVDTAYSPESQARWELVSQDAEVLLQMGKIEDARSHLLATQDAISASPNRNRRLILSTLLRLASVYSRTSEYELETDCYANIADILEADSTSLPELADACESTARFHLRDGDIEASTRFAERCFEIRNRNFSDASLVLPEKELITLGRQLIQSRDLLLSIYAANLNLDTSLRSKFAAVASRAKAPLYDALYEQRRRLTQTEDGALASLVDSLQFVRSKLATLYFKTSDTSSERNNAVNELTNVKLSLELTITRKTGRAAAHDFASILSVDSPFTLSEVDSPYINYVRFSRTYPKSTAALPEYVSVVQLPGEPPVVQFLGKSSVVEKQVRLYREHLYAMADKGAPPTHDDLHTFRSITKELAETIWSPIVPSLGTTKSVMISPDGELFQVAYGSFPVDDTTFLAERLNISYSGAHFPVAGKGSVAVPATGLLAFGDIDYDASESERSLAVHSKTSANTKHGGEFAMRSVRGSCDGAISNKAAELPGTDQELEAIARGLASRTDLIRVCRRAEGSEENFQSLAPGHRLLHIATHGFFTSSDCQQKTQSRWAARSTAIQENPLLQCGLLLAGANRRFDSSTTFLADDGVLTGEEIVGMDLRGVETVVLSGCETGLGLADAGEGIRGLQRAFTIAGAKSIVSSLWPVPDAATARIMADAYEHSSSLARLDIQTSCLTELKSLRKRRQPPHPFLWAAFVVTRSD